MSGPEMSQISPEICAKIVQFVGFASDLASLSRVCKAFQASAQARLFKEIILQDPETTYLVCQSINGKNGRLGSFVRRFWMVRDARRMRDTRSSMSRTIWQEIHNALRNMANLQFLQIQDPTASNSWILASPFPEFQLLEVNIEFMWDANVVSFLQTQKRLRYLQSLDSMEDGPPCPVPSGALKTLESYNGPILIANELLGSPLIHLQVMTDEESVLLMPNILSDLGSINKSLRSLSILFLPQEILLEALQLISRSAFVNNLRYLGLLPLPVMDVCIYWL